MRKLVLATAAVAALAATPALAQTKETRVSTPAVQVVEKVVVREVPGPERIVVKTVEVPAPARTRTSDAFTGWKVGAAVGVADVDSAFDDGFNDVTYELNAGYDAPIGDRVVAGVDVAVRDFLDDHRQVGAGARLGVAVSESALPFARVGYSSVDLGDNSLTLSGLEVGGGVEFALNDSVSITPEYRYTDFNHGREGSHGARLGVTFRF